MTKTAAEAGMEASSSSGYSTDLDRVTSYNSVGSQWAKECLAELRIGATPQSERQSTWDANMHKVLWESEDEEDTIPETTSLPMNLVQMTIQDPSPHTQVTPTLQDSNSDAYSISDSDSISYLNSASVLHSMPKTATASASPFLSMSSQAWAHGHGRDSDPISSALASWNGQESDPCKTPLGTPDTLVCPHTVGLTLPAAICLFVTDSNTDDTPSAANDDSEEELATSSVTDLREQVTKDDSMHAPGTTVEADNNLDYEHDRLAEIQTAV